MPRLSGRQSTPRDFDHLSDAAKSDSQRFPSLFRLHCDSWRLAVKGDSSRKDVAALLRNGECDATLDWIDFGADPGDCLQTAVEMEKPDWVAKLLLRPPAHLLLTCQAPPTGVALTSSAADTAYALMDESAGEASPQISDSEECGLWDAFRVDALRKVLTLLYLCLFCLGWASLVAWAPTLAFIPMVSFVLRVLVSTSMRTQWRAHLWAAVAPALPVSENGFRVPPTVRLHMGDSLACLLLGIGAVAEDSAFAGAVLISLWVPLYLWLRRCVAQVCHRRRIVAGLRQNGGRFVIADCLSLGTQTVRTAAVACDGSEKTAVCTRGL